jgi:predicted Zn-ribbon and HTH transcriptional regulator
MTAAYSGRWRWPVEECDHVPERRVQGHDVVDGRGQLVRRFPEYCRDCGYTFAPPPTTPAADE